jgi:hypothetical protein
LPAIAKSCPDIFSGGRHPVIQKELLERLPDRAAFPA